MVTTSIRLRDDQRAYITQVVEQKATDLSEFIRLCVDKSARVVAKKLPRKKTLSVANGRRKVRAL